CARDLYSGSYYYYSNALDSW
nr:immunoglobulin heavy chain junction region [Macaca mulatta]